MRSFLRVPFGAPLWDVERRFPGGTVEASPTGEDAFRLIGVDAGGLRYDAVIFVFDPKLGMQLVIASFPPVSTKTIWEWANEVLGKPAQCRNCERANPELIAASWIAGVTPKAIYDGPSHHLILFGPEGSRMKEDVELLGQRGDLGS